MEGEPGAVSQLIDYQDANDANTPGERSPIGKDCSNQLAPEATFSPELPNTLPPSHPTEVDGEFVITRKLTLTMPPVVGPPKQKATRGEVPAYEYGLKIDSGSLNDDKRRRDQTPSCEIIGQNMNVAGSTESPIETTVVGEDANSSLVVSEENTTKGYTAASLLERPKGGKAKVASPQITAIDKFVGYSAEVNRFFENIFHNVGLQISKYPCFMLLWVLAVQMILAWGFVTIDIEKDVYTLILGEDSIIYKIGEWQSYISDLSVRSNETEETSSGVNFIIIQGARDDEGNMMEPKYLLDMRKFMKTFLMDWTTTCPEFPSVVLGYRDVAMWDLYNADYAAVGKFPLNFIDPIGCFKEGDWMFTENSEEVLQEIPEIGFDYEWGQKQYSLAEINASFSGDELITETSKGIMSCWKYFPAYDARLPFSYLIGGMEFPRNDSAIRPGEYVMVHINGVNWEAGYIDSVGNKTGTFKVVDAVTRGWPHSENASYDELRGQMSSFTAVQTIGFTVGSEEFAKRIQRHHYGYCDTTGHLNGKFDCSNDDHLEDILEKAPNCYKRLIIELGEAMRTSIKHDDWLIDIALLHQYDAESIANETGQSAINQVLVAIFIMIGFIFIIGYNPVTPAQSKSIVGTLAVPLVCLSTMAGMGLCQLLFRFDFTPRTMQVLPFLGVGLGVDDMLVLLWTYSYQKDWHKIQEEMPRAMTIAGVSISLTSLTNLISFIIGTMMPLKELALFATVAAFVQVTNYIAIVFGFGAMLVLDNRRRAAKTAPRKTSGSMSYYSRDRKSSIIQDWRLESQQKPLGYRKIKNISKRVFTNQPSCCICWFSLAIFGICAYGAFFPGPELGESIGDYIPESHGLSSYFYYYEKYFTTCPASFGVGYLWENGKPSNYKNDHFSSRWSDIKGYYEAYSNLNSIVLRSTWLESFESWVTAKAPLDAEGLPREETRDIPMRGYHPSTGWPGKDCAEPSNETEVPRPYAACGALEQAPQYTCIGDFECRLVGTEVCGVGCDDCQSLINRLIINKTYTCRNQLPIECQELRYGGGQCFSQEGDTYNYIGRAGVCFEPPANEDSTNEVWKWRHMVGNTMDECINWCNDATDCAGFAYWNTNNTDQNTGCRPFDKNGASCTTVNASITENRGIVSLFKVAVPRENETNRECGKGYEGWYTDYEYQDRCFSELLRHWVSNSGSGQRAKSELTWSNGKSEPGENDFLVATFSDSYITTGAMGGALDGAKIIESMQQSRDLFNDFAQSEIGPWSSSVLYNLYDQFMEVDRYLWSSLGYIMSSIFVCSLIFILHPIAAVILIFCLFCTLVEIYGVLYWSDINVNGMLALNLVVACGITVEFTAHINRHFMLANGNPNYRIANSLGNMFLPVTLGALTTVLAVSFMAFSDIPYTRVYYFRLFVIITGFGWFNGVFLQSALLSLAASIFKNTFFDLGTISIDAPIDLDQQVDTMRESGIGQFGFLLDSRPSRNGKVDDMLNLVEPQRGERDAPQGGSAIRGGSAPAQRRNSIEYNISPIRRPGQKGAKDTTDFLYRL